MRIAPHVLANVTRWEQAEKDIWRNAVVTHGHPRAIVGAVLSGFALSSLLSEAVSPGGREFIAYLGEQVKRFAIPDDRDFGRWIAIWDQGPRKPFRDVYADTLEEAVTKLRIAWAGIRDGASPGDVLSKLGCFAPQTRGSGLGTVVAGTFLFARARRDALETLILTANLLGSAVI